MTVNLQGKMPEGDGNGLTAITDELIAQAVGKKEKRLFVAVCLIDCAKLTTNADTGATVPTARVRRIEVVDGEDKELAEGLMRRALDNRMGREALPYDLEKEVRGIFDAPTGKTVDPGTGEVQGGDSDGLDEFGPKFKGEDDSE